MLFVAVGRTDLVSDDRTEELTRAQYRSARRLSDELPGQASVHPTHGLGSFCSATKTSGDASTIGQGRGHDLALVSDHEERFVEQLLAGLGACPCHYANVGGLDAAGAPAPDLSAPEQVDAEVLPRTLVRIGVDHGAGAAVGDVDDLAGGRVGSYRVATFDDLIGEYPRAGMVVLDVRRPDKWEEGHLVGALHIPLWELADRMDELPDAEVWVHCASGFRASIGASIVDRAGRDAVLIDDDWERAGELGLPIEPAPPAT